MPNYFGDVNGDGKTDAITNMYPPQAGMQVRLAQ
jgi:hypothetical protein